MECGKNSKMDVYLEKELIILAQVDGVDAIVLVICRYLNAFHIYVA